MTLSRLALLLFVTACGVPTSEGAPDAAPTPPPDAGGLPVPAEGWQVKTPDITMAPGQEATYCYYFHTPNAATTVIQRWESEMTAGSHHMILFFNTSNDPITQADGTIGSCTGSTGSDAPVWAYLAQTPSASAMMPADDGTGHPVGMAVAPGQAAALQMHYLNTTEAPMQVHVALNAVGYPAGTTYTPAAAFVTFNTKILIPAGVGMTASVSGSCAVPPTAKFFTLTTHAHKQAVATKINDGATTIVDSVDWEHPTVKDWGAPFYSFASGKLTYECDYVNGGNAEIRTGPSAETDEMCMAVGYSFPATTPTRCINSTIAP
jgi:hypothetical protein